MTGYVKFSDDHTETILEGACLEDICLAIFDQFVANIKIEE